MFMFTMIFVFVQMIITWQFIKMIAEFVNDLPSLYLRYWGWRIVTYKPTAFIIDLIISMIIGWFTGEGMTSGFANLTSGVIISFVSGYILEWKFKYSKVFQEYEKLQFAKKERSPYTKFMKFFKIGKYGEKKVSTAT